MKTTRHNIDCKMAFGRKDPTCPRCQELIAGAEPVKWNWQSAAQIDAQRVREIRAHFASHKHMSGGCGPVCTFGEW